MSVDISIKNIVASKDGKEILKGVSLDLNKGNVHALMGKNGAGKSTLFQVLAGNPGYKLEKGSVWYKGKELLAKSAEERANMGLFLAFQSPTDIPGLPLKELLFESMKQKYIANKKEPMSRLDFNKYLEIRREALEIPKEFLSRSFNVGMSGGERKRIELLQMAVLEPDFILLDEVDSGLDPEALNLMARIILVMKKNTVVFVISHAIRFLEYLQPEKVFLMENGKIVKEGGFELAAKVDKEGF